jgi:hypothetical protein
MTTSTFVPLEESVDVVDERGDAIQGWWEALEEDVIDCLRRHGPLSPAQLAGVLGFSEATATSLILMLAAERRVRIGRVELGPPAACRAEDELAAAA